jgi:hypothetical protein
MAEEVLSPNIIQRYKDKFTNLTSMKVNLFSDEAITWFRTRISKDSRPNQNTLLNSSYKKKKASGSPSLIGKLYFYHYKAEMAGDPITGTYDAYPMVFFFNSKKDLAGNTILYGLNVHYLSPKEKQILFLEILKVRSTKNITERTRSKITWDIIKSVVSSSIYEKAVHAYRVDRFKSPMVEIPPTDWSIAVFLKLEKFVRVDGEKVYQSAVKKSLRKRK